MRLWDDRYDMKLLLTLAGLAAMLGGAAPAYADGDDDMFLGTLRAAGITLAGGTTKQLAIDSITRRRFSSDHVQPTDVAGLFFSSG